jgi:hypothetical protein
MQDISDIKVLTDNDGERNNVLANTELNIESLVEMQRAISSLANMTLEEDYGMKLPMDGVNSVSYQGSPSQHFLLEHMHTDP